MPAVRRDLSLVLADPAEADVEVLGDRARNALGTDSNVLAALEIKAVTPTAELLPAAVDRLRMAPVLLQLVLQPLDRTLTGEEASQLRDRVYVALHQGKVQELVAG